MMKVCWMFVILMGCRIFDEAQSQNSCTCNDKLEMVCIPVGDHVLVPCPELTGEVIIFNLFKNQDIICNYSCTHDKSGPNCTTSYNRGGVDLHVEKQNQSVSFKLAGVNASNYGVYRCMGTVMFPPPLLPPVPGAVKIALLVEGHQCMTNNPGGDPGTAEGQSSNFLWIWVPVLVFVIIYSVIITTLAVFFWVKLKRTDSQSDYMNTKPRAPKGHKRNRGVQNPAPRYF